MKVAYGKAKLKLKEGTHYTVAYKNNKKVGLATVTVTGKGNYTGTKKATFKINPKPMELTEATAGKKQLTVKWEARKDVTGYEIQYGLKSNFKDAKTVKITKAKTVSKVIKSLKANKKYFVRIRVYKTVNNKNYYSSWSKKKSATTEK